MGSEVITNQEVNLSDRVAGIRVEEMQLHSLSPKYRSLNIMVTLIIGAIFIAILALLALQPFFPLPAKYSEYHGFVITLILFLCCWSVIYRYFADPKKKYAIREFDVHFQSGLLFFSTISQPIMRIQHIEIERGPIERIAGLATLQVYSAGGANFTFKIPGLEYEKAIQLRQFILNHKDVSKDG